MITNLLSKEASHITIDLFKKQLLLITFDNVFTQTVGPSYFRSAKRSNLKFWATRTIS